MYSRFWGIFWIDGRSKTSIASGFSAIARMCDYHDQSLEGSMMWLQNLDHSWLLILDNADNKDLDMAQFLPAGRNGSILITTRLTENENHQTAGTDRYERLNQTTAINLLFKACKISPSLREDHEDDARAVVELLGCHALAIIQAGAAISQGWSSLGEYEKIFLDQRHVLLDYSPGQAQSEYGGVYATFEVSARYLEERDDDIAKDALQLLNFYGFIHFSDFPETAFEEAWKNSTDDDVISSQLLPDGEESIEYLSPWHVSHLPTFLRRSTHNTDLDKMRLRKARSLLASLSLVTFDPTTKMTRMHPVSHFWSRDRLREPEISTSARLSCLSLLLMSIKYPYEVHVPPLVRQLQTHIETISRGLTELGDSQKAYSPGDEFYIQQSIYRLSHVLLRLFCASALLEILEMIPIQTNESWIRSENGQNIQLLHGISMREFGDPSRAIELLERLNEARVQSLPAEDPKVLTSQYLLARAYFKKGDIPRAVALFEQIVHIQEKTMGPEHPNLLRSQHELATAYMDMEETKRAVPLLEKVLEMRIKILRPEHPNRLCSEHELARAYLDIGETKRAVPLLEEVLEMRIKTLRPEHPHRLMSQHSLAIAYLRIGEADKAITILELVVEMRAKTLRAEDPDRLGSQHELARAYLDIGETGKATAILELVVEIRARTLRAYSSNRISSIFMLARCYYRARDYERALELARSIQGVVQNRPGQKIADWNEDLIGMILEKLNEGNLFSYM